MIYKVGTADVYHNTDETKFMPWRRQRFAHFVQSPFSLALHVWKKSEIVPQLVLIQRIVFKLLNETFGEDVFSEVEVLSLKSQIRLMAIHMKSLEILPENINTLIVLRSIEV